jgi:hypothetical protein
MARRRFDSVTGGLVDTVVSGVGARTATAIDQIGRGPNASFSVNPILGGIVEDTAGYALNTGQNYILSQMSERLTSPTKNALVDSVITQVATAGVNRALEFATQSIPFLGGQGLGATTAGLGAQAARSTVSIPDSVASKLEEADYGGITYTLQDITFTLTPANAGAQTQPPPQTPPTIPLDVGFDADAAKSLAPMDALKGSTALVGPARGLSPAAQGPAGFGNNFLLGGRNQGAIFGSGNQVGSAASGLKPIKPLF